jgi:MFS family permease
MEGFSYGFGALIGSVFAIVISKHHPTNKLVTFSFLAGAILSATYMFLKNFPMVLVVAICLGFCCSLIRILLYSHIMSSVSSKYIGRVMSSANIFTLLMQVFSVVLVAEILDMLPLSVNGFIAYTIVMVIGLIFSLMTIMRRKTDIKNDNMID